MQASEIISKKVISIYEAKFIGIIEDILINKRSHKLMYLKIYDELNDTYFLLNIKNIYSFGKSAVLIRNASLLHLAENLESVKKDGYNPLNTLVLNLQGEEIGTICDITFSNKFIAESAVISGHSEQIHIKDFLNIGKDVSIINSSISKKLFHFSPKKKMPRATDYKVNIISNNPVAIETEEEQEKEQEAEVHGQPKRIITDYKFLLNRKITDNIYLSNGELLLKKNSTINAESITKARLNGKLVELTQKSRK